MPPTLLCIKPKMPGATGLNPAWDARREPATGVPPLRTAISGCNSLIFGVQKIDPAEGRPYLALEPPARPTTAQDLLRPARCDAGNCARRVDSPTSAGAALPRCPPGAGRRIRASGCAAHAG